MSGDVNVGLGRRECLDVVGLQAFCDGVLGGVRGAHDASASVLAGALFGASAEV